MDSRPGVRLAGEAEVVARWWALAVAMTACANDARDSATGGAGGDGGGVFPRDGAMDTMPASANVGIGAYTAVLLSQDG